MLWKHDVAVTRGTVFQEEVRPGSGFKTGDLILVERLAGLPWKVSPEILARSHGPDGSRRVPPCYPTQISTEISWTSSGIGDLPGVCIYCLCQSKCCFR